MDDRPAPGPDEFGDLSEQDYGKIKSELGPGERLLWAGRPMPRPIKFGGGTAVAAILAVIFLAMGGLALAAVFGFVWPQNVKSDSPFLGIILLTIGLMLVVGMIANWSSKKTNQAAVAKRLYALTDQRAILWRPAFQLKAVEVHSIQRGRIAKVHRVEYPDGSGDVVFSDVGVNFMNPDVVPDTLSFEALPDVRRVEDLLRRTLIAPDANMT